ncbi:MucB/RseB C-terminal domain-containing protein [Chitinimonas sp. BJYL2]|uniref:MucB/RseB C-terminal domain-containing protein n=1 Tax=Chitinimonas sp. BJYL2 TaxID=2976696 RepID=UPI0022B42E72|nr:MucB/RseB C-terminal domain-containing protein [Chitinimonas sp. BJYL2]
MPAALLRSALLFLMLGLPAQASEQMTTAESAALLRKMGAAARVLNYSGVYLFQRQDSMETFRLAHVFDAAGEQERRESLDGLPREFVRNNDQITCYMPNMKPFQLDRRAANKFFPGIIPDQIVDVLSNYTFRKLNVERVAGYECQVVALDPRDKLRNPHRLCVEPNSGLMLKSAMYNPDRTVQLEQFTFTQLQIGGHIDKQALKPVLANKALPVTPVPRQVAPSPPQLGGDYVEFNSTNVPPGFRLVKETHTQLQGRAAPVLHYLYSDGMATVSVFIEPASNAQVDVPLAQGNVSFYTRQVAGWRITAVGEVPLRTVQLFAQSYVPR